MRGEGKGGVTRVYSGCDGLRGWSDRTAGVGNGDGMRSAMKMPCILKILRGFCLKAY